MNLFGLNRYGLLRAAGHIEHDNDHHHQPELDLSGDVNLLRTADGMTLNGGMTIDKGRLPVFNNTFTVVRGDLDFSREVGFDPQVDVDAETKYRLRSQYSSNSIIEVIGVHVTGPLSGPEIQFSSERGYSRAAIQRMLLGLEPHATPEGDDAEAQARYDRDAEARRRLTAVRF